MLDRAPLIFETSVNMSFRVGARGTASFDALVARDTASFAALVGLGADADPELVGRFTPFPRPLMTGVKKKKGNNK